MAQKVHRSPIKSTPDMASQDVAIQQPKLEAVECHFFKLPPELRLIIYDMVLADFQVTVKGEDNVEETDQISRSEAHENAQKAVERMLSNTDVTRDASSAVRFEDYYHPAGEERLVRAPLLDVCQLIRQEAAPPYIVRVKALALPDLADATEFLTKMMNHLNGDDFLGPSGMHGPVLGLIRSDLRYLFKRIYHVYAVAMDNSINAMVVIKEARKLEAELKGTANLTDAMEPVRQNIEELTRLRRKYVDI